MPKENEGTLGKLNFFTDFSEDEIDQILKISETKSYFSNSIVLHEDIVSDRMYIISEGYCEISIVQDSNRVRLDILERGNIFGEISVINGTKTTATVSSISNVTLIEVKKDKLNIILSTPSTFSLKFIKKIFGIISEKLRRTNLHYANIDTLLLTIAQTNRELKVANLKLSELTQLKNKFVGMAAHDIRSPINIILGNLEIFELISGGTLRADEKKILKDVKDECNFILDLINKLLDISKIESGTLELTMKEINIGDIISECVQYHEMLAKKRQIKFLIEKTSATFPAIYADPHRIKEVMNNLYSNAIKYSETNSVITTAINLDGGNIIISIKDEGIGIPESKLKEIFLPFSTLHKMSLTGERSTGLGLAIVKKIVESHGGSVWAESAPSAGSTFHISLPVENK